LYGTSETDAAFYTENEDPLFHEHVNVVRAKFEYKIESLGQKVLAVTSAVAGEGKTLLSAKLALQLASSGRKKVLLVEVDFRKPVLAKVMNLSPLPGLSEYLTGAVPGKSIFQNSLQPGLYVVPAGILAGKPGDLLTGERFKKFLKTVAGEFDIVLLDCPPILPVADTLNLRGQVGGFVFVYRTGMTPHKMFKNAVDEIGEKNVLGVILNDVKRQRKAYYTRYYGKYYHKAEKQEAPA
jgi:capsular exopolysaccharide synthesis family protein